MSQKLHKNLLLFCVFLLTSASFLSEAQTANSNVGLRTIVIDPGHGGKDPGAPGPDSKNCEKNIVLNISKLLGDKIKKQFPNVKVVYTRSTDVFPKLTDRVKTAHDHNADLFISIHCNSSKNKAAFGTSAHILSRKDSRNPNRDLFDENVELTKLENSVIQFEEDQSRYNDDSPEDQILNTLLFNANYDHSILLSQLLVEKLCTTPFQKWGKGIHQNDFLLLKKMTCPAVLVETAFLSNAKERQLLVSPKWQQEIAERLFQAFKEYKIIYDASVGAPVDLPVASEAEKPASAPEVKPTVEEFYGVQIMGLGRLLKNGDPALKGLEVKAVKADDSSIYKYVYGNYKTLSEAKNQLPTVRKKFPEAFVVKVSGNIVARAK
jgi:N-acetylmuramoyl-L-alanine amidase